MGDNLTEHRGTNYRGYLGLLNLLAYLSEIGTIIQGGVVLLYLIIKRDQNRNNPYLPYTRVIVYAWMLVDLTTITLHNQFDCSYIGYYSTALFTRNGWGILFGVASIFGWALDMLILLYLPR